MLIIVRTFASPGMPSHTSIRSRYVASAFCTGRAKGGGASLSLARARLYLRGVFLRLALPPVLSRFPRS